MKKLCFLFLLIFLVFSCKGTPNKDNDTDDPGLSQLDLTAENENDEQAAGFDDEPQSEKETLAQDGITDGSKAAENPAEEKPAVVEAKDEVKETPKTEEKKPPVEEKKPPAQAVKQAPPLAVIKEEPSKAQAPADEKPDEEKQDAQDEVKQEPLPRVQQVLTPPPAVTAVKDDAPVPNQRGPVLPKEEEGIVFSRIVNATVGQLVEIPFRGTGWVYLGELASRRGLAYNSRRLDIEGQNFIFNAEEAGTFALKFFKHDYIRDYILNDYVQVVVSEPPNKNGGAGWFNPPADRNRVTAEPRWPSALEEEAMLRGGPRPASGAQPAAENKNGSSAASSQTASSNRDSAASQTQGAAAPTVSANRDPAPAQTQGTFTAPPAAQTVTPAAVSPPVTAVQTPPAEIQEKLTPEEILKKAQDAFKEGNASGAIALLDQYNEFYPGGSDELYWLYGQFYEANTKSRNILLSLDYYRRLVNEYPQSRRYNDARRRIAYLERFYINIQ